MLIVHSVLKRVKLLSFDYDKYSMTLEEKWGGGKIFSKTFVL